MLGRIGDAVLIENMSKKFGANKTYYLVRLQMPDGEEVDAMFTEDQIDTAIDRAKANPEDVPKNTIIDKVRDALD